MENTDIIDFFGNILEIKDEDEAKDRLIKLGENELLGLYQILYHT